jgi:hypothetical protein
VHAQQRVDAGEREHAGDQRDRDAHRVACDEHRERRDGGRRREDPEQGVLDHAPRSFGG